MQPLLGLRAGSIVGMPTIISAPDPDLELVFQTITADIGLPECIELSMFWTIRSRSRSGAGMVVGMPTVSPLGVQVKLPTIARLDFCSGFESSGFRIRVGIWAGRRPRDRKSKSVKDCDFGKASLWYVILSWAARRSTFDILDNFSYSTHMTSTHCSHSVYV